MIEMIWHDKNPPIDKRVFRLKSINQLIMVADFPYSADGVNLTTYEHKNVLIRCHNMHSDNMFSVTDYHHELMVEFSEKITTQLMNKGCIIVVKAPDNEYILATDLGRSVAAGLSPVELTHDEADFLRYLIDASQPLELDERYKDDELEILEGDE